MLVISTQYRENYGTPDDPYWKNKGGFCYKVLNAPVGVSVSEIAKVCDIEYKSDMSEEYIICWSHQDDEWLSPFEKEQLEYEGKITYHEPIIDYNEVMEAAYA
jgi:hypothetical protein